MAIPGEKLRYKEIREKSRIFLWEKFIGKKDIKATQNGVIKKRGFLF